MFKINNLTIFIIFTLKLSLLLLFIVDAELVKFINFFPQSNSSLSYHSMVFYIFSPLYTLVQFLNFDSLFFSQLIIKLPLLIADLVIFLILLKMFPDKKSNITLYYFSNPILLYVVYIYGLLDIIVLAWFMSSLYFLTKKNNNILSAIFMALALSTKAYILIALPIIFYFIYRKEKVFVVLNYMIITLVTWIVIDAPYLFEHNFFSMLKVDFLPLIKSFGYEINGLKLMIPFVSIFLVYYFFFNQKRVINNHLLYLYLGVLFIIGLFFTSSLFSLSIYVVPFLAIYFIQHENQVKALIFYILFSLSFLAFSMVIDTVNCPFSFVKNEFLQNLFFTFWSVFLMITLNAFRYSIERNSLYQKSTNLTIGVGGDSGVGKSLLLTNLTLLFQNKLLQIEGDGEHKWERGDEHWKKFTHLDPKANYIHKQVEAINALRHHNVTYRSEYNHDTGKFTTPAKVEPREIIVLSGLHPFYLPRFRKIIDLKIYLDTEEKLRRHWKIIRDTSKRGYSKEKILEQIRMREKDTQKYIYPQKKFADLIIHYFALNDFELGEAVEIKKGLKLTIDASVYIESILDALKVDYIWDYNEDLKTQYIKLREEPSNDFNLLSKKHIVNLDQIVDINPMWKSGYEGFVQFIILFIISKKLQEEI